MSGEKILIEVLTARGECAGQIEYDLSEGSRTDDIVRRALQAGAQFHDIEGEESYSAGDVRWQRLTINISPPYRACQCGELLDGGETLCWECKEEDENDPTVTARLLGQRDVANDAGEQ